MLPVASSLSWASEAVLVLGILRLLVLGILRVLVSSLSSSASARMCWGFFATWLLSGSLQWRLRRGCPCIFCTALRVLWQVCVLYFCALHALAPCNREHTRKPCNCPCTSPCTMHSYAAPASPCRRVRVCSLYCSCFLLLLRFWHLLLRDLRCSRVWGLVLGILHDDIELLCDV